MQTKKETKISLDRLQYLPAFAQYLLEEKLDEMARLQIEIAHEINLPLLRYLQNYSPDQLFEISRENLKDYLNYLSENRARKQIENSVLNWKKNILPIIRKTDIVAEDITLMIYLRKKAFLYFLPDYCSGTEQLLELVKEIDWFLLENETVSTNFYIQLLKERIDEHIHFIEKITNTSPGIIYVYDVINNKEIYANKITTEFLGFTPEDIMAMGDTFVETLIYPEDLPGLKAYESEFKSTKDGEVRSFKYRIKNKSGDYRWMRTYETVFKRTEAGEVSEKIGIAIDIHQQKLTADKLHKREEELLEAQEIAQMGSFVWDFENLHSAGSPQTEKILGIDFNDHDAFMSRVHPEDKQKVEKAIADSHTSGKYECEYRFLSDQGEKTIWTKGLVNYIDGKPASMHGTLMDVSEREKLLQKLKRSEALYKQAEALSHIGNYSWDLSSNQITWSEELFKIYELEPSPKPIDPDFLREFNHPEDTELVSEQIEASLKTKEPFDFTYRIFTKKRKLKILQARGSVTLDTKGNPVTIIGTAQDVTEKQNLIRQLSHDAEVYRQAEELANIGSWTWDIKTNEIQWTDQMYRIYGLPPQSRKITLADFFAFIHPNDRDRIKQIGEKIVEQQFSEHSYRIITPAGKEKTVHTLARLHSDSNGNPVYVLGAEQDITENQLLLEKLRKSENIYRQAEELSNMGNWSWDIKRNKLEWTDQLYRIYGLAPQSEEITIERFLSFVHPDDRENVKTGVDRILSEKNIDYTFRIITTEGKVKVLRSLAHADTDEKGEPVFIVGTERDITEKQNLIDTLRRSEQLYKQAQSLAHLGNWTWEVETDIVEWSDEIYKIYEVPVGETITYEKVASFMHPEDRNDVLSYLQECVRSGSIYDKAHRIITRRGNLKTIHRRAEIIREKGRPVKLIGTTQDVTEFYRVQQELKDNQTFIRKITDATPSIIASYNIKSGKYVFISEGLEKLLGYPTAAVMEQGVQFFVNIVHPDDVEMITQKNAAALEEANRNPEKNDLVIEFIYRMRHSNGSYRWFHTYGTIFDRNREGLVEHILNITLDITDQKDASNKIAEQEHFIQQIADASPTILYLYDVDTQSIVYINREIFFVLGYLPEEIMEMHETVTPALYHPDDFALLPARKQSAKNFQQIDSMMQYECRLKNKDGDWRWFLVREIVFKTDENGMVKQILGAALDINRRKEMERTILQNTLQLEQSNASLEEFAYVASHDLKEPLRKISTFGDRLVATQADMLSPEGKIYLKKIVDASQRMQIMINDLLSISMISGNRSFEQYSLQKILDDSLQTLEFKIEQQHALIQYDELPEANIIPSQFRQLFQNLLSNSLKFVRENTKPVITIRYRLLSQNDTVHYQLAHAEHYHKLEFIDNGIGFENEFAGKIFAIFQRLHGRSEYEGSGIGLAICKKIVEHHGGIIYASGVPGEGATFTLILPA